MAGYSPEPKVVVIQGCENISCCFTAATMIATDLIKNVVVAVWGFLVDPGESLRWLWEVVAGVFSSE